MEWATRFREPSAETEQIIARNCAVLMESKPWTIYWFSQGQKKEHVNWMREIQFRDTSADTERIKYNTNEIKAGSSKNIDLLKVKRRHSWIQWTNKIQQRFCWRPVNHCYKCAKRKIIASKHDGFFNDGFKLAVILSFMFTEKFSYANVKGSYFRRTTTVIVNVTVLPKVLSFS